MEKHIKILHVEDDEIDHLSVMRLIKNCNLPYEVDWAALVFEAMKKMGTGNYDLVLLDYQ